MNVPLTFKDNDTLAGLKTCICLTVGNYVAFYLRKISSFIKQKSIPLYEKELTIARHVLRGILLDS